MARPDPIKQIIERSGNDLHFRIAAFLKSKDWEILVSPYYSDPSTNKSREIDIIASKKYEVPQWWGGPGDSLTIRLFIECKHIKDPQVLWFEGKNEQDAKGLALDNQILRGTEDYFLRDSSTIPAKIHHYLQNDEVMKLGSKTGNADPLYEAMNGSLNAMIFYETHQYSNMRNTIDFPILIVDSFKNLYKRDLMEKKGYKKISDDFQMEVNYSFIGREGKPKTKYFLLDVMNENSLEIFLDTLEKNDISIIKGQLQERLRKNHSQQ